MIGFGDKMLLYYFEYIILNYSNFRLYMKLYK